MEKLEWKEGSIYIPFKFTDLLQVLNPEVTDPYNETALQLSIWL